jgi:hypothetical protein
MNTLHKISCGLFATAFITGLLTYITATFLFFGSGVIVLALGVYVDDLNNNGNE